MSDDPMDTIEPMPNVLHLLGRKKANAKTAHLNAAELLDAVHAFLARLHQLIKQNTPVLLDRLLAAGAEELAFKDRNLVRDAVEERDNKVDARPKHRTQAAKPFNNKLFGLRHDANTDQNTNNNKRSQQDQDDIAPNQVG